MSTPKVLLVATSHADLGDTGGKTGTWMEEVAAPYYTLKREGFEVVIASPAGGEVPVDPKSMQDPYFTTQSKAFTEDDYAMEQLRGSLKLSSDINVEEFSACYIAGGHGIMWDGPADNSLKDIVAALFSAGCVVAAVCHGPAGLVSALGPDGKPLVHGKQVTGFSNAEEESVGLKDVVPFLLEDKLKELGGDFKAAPAWQEKVITDGTLVTGQNPASAEGVAREMIALMRAMPDVRRAGPMRTAPITL